MSTRYTHGSPYENHQRGAELHDNAAHAHLTASETHQKQEHQTGQELSRRALEYSQLAHQHTGETAAEVHEPSATAFNHHDIAVLANELWHARGCPQGSPEEDWFHAVQELRSRVETAVHARQDRHQ